MSAIILTGGSTATAGVTEILAQISAVIQMMIDTMVTLLGNPFFAFLFAVGFVSMALHLINVAKGVSRG
jgi:hypothetical protein